MCLDRRPSARRAALGFLGLATSLLFWPAPAPLQAANKTWASAVSGNFAQGVNWTPSGVPGTTDSATFSAAGMYTVTFNNSPNPLPNPTANQDLFFSGGNVTLTSGAGGPYTYQLKGAGGSDANVTGGTLSLGTGGNPLHLSVADDLLVRGGATLNVNQGSVASALDLLLAQGVGGGNGLINVDGAGSQLNVTNSSTQSLGLNGNLGALTFRNGSGGSFSGPLNVGVSNDAGTAGVLDVQTGATATIANLAVGTGTAGTGTVNISGVGSALVQSGAATLTVGAASGSVGAINIGTITTGGTLTRSGNLQRGRLNLIEGVSNEIQRDCSRSGGCAFDGRLRPRGASLYRKL